MGRKSSIDEQLSPEDRTELNKKIGNGGMTLDALVQWLDALGYEISRSSVGRYAVNINDAAQMMRESRQVTEALVAELGDASALGQQGRLLVEMLRTLVFELLLKIQNGEVESINSKDVMQLGKGLAEIAKALRSDQDYEEKIRTRLEKEIREQAANAVDEVARDNEKGLSRDTVDEIKRRILGIEEEPA